MAIFVIELLSLISFKLALLSGIFFVSIAIVVLMFTLYKLEYGLWIALAELMIGSQGYLFYLDLPGFRISMRLAIFLIVFFVWLLKYFRPIDLFNLLKKDRLVQNFIIFLCFIALGVINGIISGNGIKNVFFDVNGYLYFGLFFVFLEVFKTKRQVAAFMKVFLAALSYVSVKIFFTLYLFSHGIPYITDYFYHWIRDTRVGEITYAGGNFFRIFFQSQSWSLIGIFIILSLLVLFIQQQKKPSIVGNVLERSLQDGKWLFLLLVFIEASILISFSRTFWLGGLAGVLALAVYLIFIARLSLKKLCQAAGVLAASGVLSVLLVLAIANFPIPTPSGLFSADMFKDRFAMISGEAGVSSRWNLLPVLVEKVKEAPFIGTGFGSAVTYKTEDPRIKNEANPEGTYTTYSFEWGYLDTVTEIGFIGLFVYLLLIGQILYAGWKQRKNYIVAGLLIGLIVLMVTHAFSPYLNHPLGISYLMLCMGLFKIDL
ncbi:MAG: O-antigen ligase family protein [Candidatus Parcubacteria bacterium]|nr:O-antigen ligase family protein [Candidatus Parcubacteria bacterium]